MPAVDIALVKQRIADGLRHQDIAQELGVSRSAVSNALRRDRQRESIVAFATKTSDVSLADAAGLFLGVLSKDCQDTLARVRNRRTPQNNAKELERENVLEKLNKRARLTYGLDNDTSKSVVVGISVRLGTDVKPVRLTPSDTPPGDNRAPLDITSTTAPADPPKPQ